MELDFIHDTNEDIADAVGYRDVDAFIVRVHWGSFFFVAAMAFFASVMKVAEYYPSPFSWRVISYPEALGAVLIGFLATIIPSFLVGKLKNHYLWRILVSCTLTLYTYCAVFLSGGSIEMHFFFFVVIALIMVYSDWRLGWFVLVLVGLHHAILNQVAPEWVFSYGKNDMSVLVHSAWVLFMVILTSLIVIKNQKMIRTLRGLRTREAVSVTQENPTV